MGGLHPPKTPPAGGGGGVPNLIIVEFSLTC